MIDDYAVKLATEYLDYRFGKHEPADLAGMLNYVDYYDRVVMILEEVNEALRLRPSVFMHRVEGRVVFNQTAGEHEIREDDLRISVEIYQNDVRAQADEFENRQK